MALNRLSVKHADMTDEAQAKAIAVTQEAFKKHSKESLIAADIREALDSALGGTWCVVCGRQFGSGVTHEASCYINLTMGQLSVLIWKSS